MTTRTITLWAMLGATVAILGYDVVVATNDVTGDTISEISRDLASAWFSLPFAWGVVVGHLFWPAKEVRQKWPRIAALWALGAAVLVLDVTTPIQAPAIAAVVLGLVMGRLLWPQLAPRGA